MDEQPAIAEPVKLKRPWFQFGLRTLLIGTALLAMVCRYVGRQAEIVRARQKFIDTHRHLGTFSSTTTLRLSPSAAWQVTDVDAHASQFSQRSLAVALPRTSFAGLCVANDSRRSFEQSFGGGALEPARLHQRIGRRPNLANRQLRILFPPTFVARGKETGASQP